MFMVNTELCVAIEVPRFENASRGFTRECAELPLLVEQVRSELLLTAPHPHDFEGVSLRKEEFGYPIEDSTDSPLHPSVREGALEGDPVELSHAQLALG